MLKVSKVLLAAMALCLSASVFAQEKLKILLIDGQNNHDWKSTSPVIKWALEDCGRFTVDVSTTPGGGPRQPQALKAGATEQQKEEFKKALAKYKEEKETAAKNDWSSWHPKFKDYAAVVSNYNGQDWPEAVQKDFVEYVKDGGGFVAVHAADNSFPKWAEYNEMIGLGGWGGRNEKNGPMVRWRDGKFVRDEQPGAGGTHGKQHEFVVEIRDPQHPIVKGLPEKWMHASDELYSKLRGPAKNMQILATAFHAKAQGGTEENEPMLIVVPFGKGRAFHTTLGHSVTSMSGLGFQVTLCRGTEWVATGTVTLPAPKPEELPADKAGIRKPTFLK